jgi:hypothetical protein
MFATQPYGKPLSLYKVAAIPADEGIVPEIIDRTLGAFTLSTNELGETTSHLEVLLPIEILTS